MNKQEIAGNVSKITGKIKEKAGELIEDEGLQTEGKVQYLSGMLQEYYGIQKSKVLKSVNNLIDSLSKPKVVQPKPEPVKV